MEADAPRRKPLPTGKGDISEVIKNSLESGRTTRMCQTGETIPFCESMDYPGSAEVDWDLTRSLWAEINCCCPKSKSRKNRGRYV